MLSLNEKIVVPSFVNATRKELSELSLPADFGDVRWEKLDYYGWRDAKTPRRSWILVPVGDEVVGVVLKRADADPRQRAQCSWCQDITLPNDVVIYGARRSGHGGKAGNTLATLICADFECSTNVRKLPPMAYIGFDQEAARDNRIIGLQERAAAFVAAVAVEA